MHLGTKSWFLNTILQKRNLDSSRPPPAGLKQGKHKMRIEHFVVPESNEMLKKIMGYKNIGANLKDLLSAKVGTI